MNKTVIQELKSKTKSMYKKGWPRLVGITAVLFLILYATISLLSVTYFASIILLYFALPIIFTVTLEVYGLISNLRNKKVAFQGAFKLYFTVGKGMYRALRTILFGLLISIGARFVFSLIGVGFLALVNPSLLQELSTLNLTDIKIFQEFVADNYEVFNIFYLLVDAATLIPVVIFVSSETRKYEMSFYSINYIITENKTRIAPSYLTAMIFKKAMFPTIKREYRNINFRLNWLGYLLFFLAYIGGVALSVVIRIDFTFGACLPFLFAFLFYLPFYSYARIFDSLFSIAFADEIMARVGDEVRATLNQARHDVATQSQALKESLPEALKDKYKNQEGGIILTDEEKRRFEEEDRKSGESNNE